VARLVWTEPALDDLNAIAEYVALDKPDAAAALVARVLDAVARLQRYPLRRVPISRNDGLRSSQPREGASHGATR